MHQQEQDFQSAELVELDPLNESDQFPSVTADTLLAAPDLVACPYCAEPIRLAAKICKHCGSTVRARSRGEEYVSRHRPMQRSSVSARGGHSQSPGVAALLAFFVPGAGHLYAGRIGIGLTIFFLNLVAFTVSAFAPLLYLGAIAFWIWQVFDASNCASGGSSHRNAPARRSSRSNRYRTR